MVNKEPNFPHMTRGHILCKDPSHHSKTITFRRFLHAIYIPHNDNSFIIMIKLEL